MTIAGNDAIRSISVDEALHMIDRCGLSTVRRSWHYSWNLKQFYDDLFTYERDDRLYVFHPTPIHSWAPAPIFSNDETLDVLVGQKGKGCPYWFLKLTDFETFLDRRSAISRRPDVHFPSRQTYQRSARKMQCHLARYKLFDNEHLFHKWYDNLKAPKYNHTAVQCISDALKSSARAPRDWFIFYALIEDGSDVCKCISLMIEDGRSCSGINIASERSNLSYGTFLLVEVIKDLCTRGYGSFDCGVSGRYGTYKEKIYLDVLPVDSSGNLPFVRCFEPSAQFGTLNYIREQFAAQLRRLGFARPRPHQHR